MRSELIFSDGETPVDALVEELSRARFALDQESVAQLETARAKEGEAWSPQLLAYDEWGAGAGVEAAEGHDGDLMQIGFMTGLMSWENEERDKLVAKAVAEGAVADAWTSAVLTPASAKTGRAFMVRPVEGGYALVGVDLRMLSEQAGAHNVVLALPSYIGGVPVVRVTAEAFARRYVRGVDVRLLVVPDTVELLDAGALSALSARHVHLGAGVGLPFSQPCDSATVSPRLGGRTYSVAPENESLAARDGSLYSRDGAQLLFLAPPYGQRVELPAGVARIEAAALFKSADMPRVVAAPSTLEHVAPKEFDDAVWLCAEGAPARGKLAARGVRTASMNAVERGGCWYDFCEDGAFLVAGPPAPKTASRTFAEAAAARVHAGSLGGESAPGETTPGESAPGESAGAAPSPFEAVKAFNAQAPAADELVLPAQVDGRPLVRIGVRALATAPATLVVPPTVREVLENNACKGTRRLMLSEGLKRIGAHCFWSRTLQVPVPIPASVHSIGEGCFEYSVCRLEATGSVVHVSADQLKSCFLEAPAHGVPFDFDRYDNLLKQGATLPDATGALLHRMADPCAPSAETRAALCARLKQLGAAALKQVAREGNVSVVKALVEAGFIDEGNFDAQIEFLRQANRADCVLFLMEAHGAARAGQKEAPGQNAPARATSRDRFRL